MSDNGGPASQDSAQKPERRVKEIAKKCVALKKLDSETARLLGQIKERANKKTLGRKIRDSEVIHAALKLIEPQHIKDLQEATYSERDRFQMLHESFQKEHGKISMDQFIGKILRGEVRTASAE